MSLYLAAQCGAVQILVNVIHVLEVLDKHTGHTDRTLLGHYHWREQILPLVDMPLYFGLQGIDAHRLVVIDSGVDDPALRYMVLAVESSEQLLTLDDAALVDMAQHNDALVPVFSAIYSPHDSSACQLVLRFPAAWLSSLVRETVAA